MDENRTEELRKIKDEVVAFHESPLYAYRAANSYKPVIGEGSHSAEIVFVGEAPGRTEAETGRPFSGAAGRVLDELFAAIGMVRGDVYITNILKDRPPQNRDPLPEEIRAYAPFLDRQLAILKPRVVVALGRFAMAYCMERLGLQAFLGPISALHGKVFEGTAPYGAVKFVPLYHPAVAVYNPTTKESLKLDFQILKELTAKTGEGR